MTIFPFPLTSSCSIVRAPSSGSYGTGRSVALRQIVLHNGSDSFACVPVRTLAVQAESPAGKPASRRTVPPEGLGKLSRARSYDPRCLPWSSGPLLNFPFLSSFPILYSYRGFYSPRRYAQASTTTHELRGDSQHQLRFPKLRQNY